MRIGVLVAGLHALRARLLAVFLGRLDLTQRHGDTEGWQGEKISFGWLNAIE